MQLSNTKKISLSILVLAFIALNFHKYILATPADPDLPQAYVDTTAPTQTGATLTVDTSSNCNGVNGLQAKIDAANLGDTIIIPAGATCTSTYRLKNKATGSGWIVIKSSLADNLPAGVRVSPADVSNMAKIVASNGSFGFDVEDGAHHYRIEGLEVTSNSAYTGDTFALINFSPEPVAPNWYNFTYDQYPHHMVVDRVYMHGHRDNSVWRGVLFSGENIATINSYISEIHTAGFDTQAIGGINSPGPNKIVNNYLEGAGENVMFGGANPVDEASAAKDLEFRGNYLYKPWTWRYTTGEELPTTCFWDPDYGSLGENYKLVDGDEELIDYYQCNEGEWELRDMGVPVNIWTVKNLFELKSMQRAIIDGNVFKNHWVQAQTGAAMIFNGVDGPDTTIENITFTNNYMTNVPRFFAASANFSQIQLRNTNTVKISNNFVKEYEYSTGGAADGVIIVLEADVKNFTFDHNTFLSSRWLIFIGDDPPTYSVDNLNITNNIFTASEVMGDSTGGPNTTMPYHAADGTLSKNVVVGAWAPHWTNWLDNYFEAASSTIGFVDFFGGDYSLSPSSLYNNAASDGTDVGVNWPEMNAAIEGAEEGTWAGEDLVVEDVTAPVISNIDTDEDTTTATITWDTDEAATTRVEYGTTLSYGSLSSLDASLTLSHTANFTGLTPGTTYYFKVVSSDAVGNTATSSGQSFTTDSLPPDPDPDDDDDDDQNVTVTVSGSGGRSGGRRTVPIALNITTPTITNQEYVKTAVPLLMSITRSLKYGSEGEDVKTIQRLLATRAWLYPEGIVNGSYGPLTQKAVQRFQKYYGISNPSIYGWGIVGPITRAKMIKVFEDY